MRSFQLNNRLQACANMISGSKRLIDIGTDHAYLPIWLIMNGRIENAIASDINFLPLQKAKANVEKYKVQDNIELRLSDGLSEISSEEADEIVIAGMGGELILDIISKADWIKKEKKKLILQPMSSEPDLRTYLYENKFRIEKEVAVFSAKKVYTIIKACYTGFLEKIPIEYPYVGKLYNNMSVAAVEYMKKQIRDLENKNIGAKHIGNLREYLKNISIINKMKEIINKFKGEIK